MSTQPAPSYQNRRVSVLSRLGRRARRPRPCRPASSSSTTARPSARSWAPCSSGTASRPCPPPTGRRRSTSSSRPPRRAEDGRAGRLEDRPGAGRLRDAQDERLPVLPGAAPGRRACARTPVVLMSAKSDRIREHFVQQTGAIDAITKPFDAQALIAVIENAIRRSEAWRARGEALAAGIPEDFEAPESLRAARATPTRAGRASPVEALQHGRRARWRRCSSKLPAPVAGQRVAARARARAASSRPTSAARSAESIRGIDFGGPRVGAVGGHGDHPHRRGAAAAADRGRRRAPCS